MDYIEVKGRTVEDCIKKALAELKVSKDQVNIQVVAEGKHGLFGMKGEKPAKVRVSIKQENSSEKT